MFYIAVNDIFSLFICDLMTGILGIYGAVFCTAPNLIFLAGICAEGQSKSLLVFFLR
jgi:hypothetical protein